MNLYELEVIKDTEVDEDKESCWFVLIQVKQVKKKSCLPYVKKSYFCKSYLHVHANTKTIRDATRPALACALSSHVSYC